jgi:endoglucanase
MKILASRIALVVAAAFGFGVLAPAAMAQDPLPPVPEPSQPWPTDPRGVDPLSPNPLLGLRFYVDRQAPAWRQWRYYRRRHRPASAAQMWKVAGEPKFRWFGRWDRPLGPRVRDYLERARSMGTVPLMVVMRHQGRKCGGGYDGGGAGEDAGTRAWYRAFAAAVGDARAVIAFEPDSLGTLECLRGESRRARLDLLRYGVDVLSTLPNATVYLEGGASDWEPAKRTARQLRYIGIARVRGFMLNVTHYDWTGNNVAHGLQISRMTGGKPFIVSTSFNGRGPVHYWAGVSGRRRRINVWCHPLRRGLGPAPTTTTADPKVDAYMWLGRPGYSGGSCNGGPLPVGSWWPRRALMFARYATDWLFPPRGTRYGLRGRFTLRQLGG